jgi:hypothetical protein
VFFIAAGQAKKTALDIALLTLLTISVMLRHSADWTRQMSTITSFNSGSIVSWRGRADTHRHFSFSRARSAKPRAVWTGAGSCALQMRYVVL